MQTMQQAPDCDMALIHDDDLERIEGIGEESVGGHSIFLLFWSRHVGSHWNPSNLTC
jgi:hypothetical protein